VGAIIRASEAPHTTGFIRDQVYNALDVTGTLAVANNLLPRLDANQQRTYAMERALQAPALAMMLRGIRMDRVAHAEAMTTLKRELAKETRAIDKMKGVRDVWDGVELEKGMCPAKLGSRHKWPRGVPDSAEKQCEHCHVSRLKRMPFNANSTTQCMRLLYKLHKIPPQYGKKGTVTADDEALQKISAKYPAVSAVVEAIISLRQIKKQLGFLAGRLSDSGRYRSSFNVGAAWTGRWSSSKNAFGEGGNLQNIAPRWRHLFIADPGMEMFYFDLEQAESNTVAHLAGDPAYIEAHQLGDVHTYVCRMIFPFLPWTGDLKLDKKIAKTNPPWDQAPDHDWRFQSKRVQHGSNYGLTPQGISMIAHIPLKEARAMQREYFLKFPYIPAWHDKVREQIRNQEALVTPLGTKVHLFGRPWDDHTWRQGLAVVPQRTVVDIVGIGLWQAWRNEPRYDFQAQVHDALVGQIPLGTRDELGPKLLKYMQVPVPINGRVMTIGVEGMFGQNWGKQSEENPRGMEVFHG